MCVLNVRDLDRREFRKTLLLFDEGKVYIFLCYCTVLLRETEIISLHIEN